MWRAVGEGRIALLLLRVSAIAGPVAYWMEWLKAAGVTGIAPQGPTLGLHLTVPAAEAGQGFALADEIIAGDALVGGRLVRPFPVAVETYGCFFVRGAARKETKAMTALRLWLEDEIARSVEAVHCTTAASGKKSVPAR